MRERLRPNFRAAGTRTWLLAVVSMLAACEGPAADGAAEGDLMASEAAIRIAPRLERAGDPDWMALRHPMSTRAAVPANLRRIEEGRGGLDCVQSCGGAPWCEAICGVDAFSREAVIPPAERLEQDCPACGRETGFLPSPPTVEAYREGSGVLVTWSEVEGADQYEVVVARRKDGRQNLEHWGDYTVDGTELRLSMITGGYVYVFTVTPYIDGELDGGLTGTSTPLNL